VTQSDRLRLAVFIDFDNIEIGVKNTVGASFDAGLVLEALKERGEVVSKTAYSDWQRAAGYSRMLTQHAIRMVQRNVTPGGDKNGADINLALDALEMAFTHPHINAFVIVGGDSDFISLVEKLKQYDKKVFVVGGRQFTSQILQRNCHEFIAYENLAGPGAGRRPSGSQARAERASLDQVIPLVKRALKVLSERDVSPQLGLLKSTLLQLDSTFSERDYGAGSFRDFAQRLEQAGVLKVHQAKGGLLVAPANGAGAPASEAAAAEPVRPPDAPPDGHAAAKGHEAQRAAPAPKGSAADGVRELRRLLETAPVRRWPLYMRNVKQVIKQVDAAFDERAYGFASIVDLLRAAGREGVLRVERDRQGVLRVFQPEPGAARTRDVRPVEPPAFGAEPPEPAPEPLPVAESDAVPDVADAPVAVPAEPAPARRSRTRRRASATPRTTTRAKAR
jgi:uncharacterized LabA/DUF88 family protein